ncbi:MAG TPA: hypothetical protein VK034_26135 [Enhygromyxa sp.]|nr:hypothetical protein [Enhygromyxa sp.]
MTRRVLAVAVAGLALGCAKVPNPFYVDEAGSETLADGGSETNGDGDGDPTGDGDGDGEPTGDGDGEPTGDGDGDPTGDGDGDSTCTPGELGCLCGVLETCDDGLACVLDKCVDASSCAPVDDFVQLSASPTWGGGDPPVAPTEPYVAICVLDGQLQGNQAVLNVHQCGGPGILQQLVLTVQPIVSPLDQLLGNPNLAATVTVVEKPEGLFVRIEAAGMAFYYVNGTSLVADGVTDYPWALAPFSSSCGQTPTMCGTLERLALLVDGGTVYDGNAGQPSPAATAWAETVVDDCGALRYELALLAY